MHIVVLGGAGAMGRVTVRTLTEYEDVDQITLADYNQGRAREVAATFHSNNVEVKQIDVNDFERLCVLIRGADKIAFPHDFLTKLKFLVDLGFGSDEPLNVRGSRVSPREVLAKLLEMTPV